MCSSKVKLVLLLLLLCLCAHGVKGVSDQCSYNSFPKNGDNIDTTAPMWEPINKGSEVVESVLQTIKNNFGDTDTNIDFLRRIAWIESKNGRDSNTFNTGKGGIFQVDKNGFQDTQDVNAHPGLKRKHKEISDQLKFCWTKTSHSDLLKPLYSGLAARLYLLNNPYPIPNSLEAQAWYWKLFYNSQLS